MTFIGILLLVALILVSISLQRTYGSTPLKELKRRARSGDPVANALFKAATYGSSLRALLWAIIVGLTALLFIEVSRESATWIALVAIAGVLWFGFIWLPAQDATKGGVWLASRAAPLLAKVLQYLHPLFIRLTEFAQKHRPVSIHTGLYDKDDLLELFDKQKVQSDNRIDQQTLEIARHSLEFADKKVAAILTPRRVVKALAASDSVGPIMMDDLHKSGHSRFPVYEDTEDNIVGVLYLKSLMKAKAGGSIQKIMQKQVCYVHEDQSLTEALQAILRTHQQLFIVVNSFEEYVGIVTIEDIMEQIVGQQIVDEFDEYEDLRAVAAKMAAKEHKAHTEADLPHENIQEVTEVIE